MHCRGHLVRIPKSATVTLESLAPGTNPFQVVQALISLETVASSLDNLRDLCDIALASQALSDAVRVDSLESQLGECGRPIDCELSESVSEIKINAYLS